MGLFGWLQGRSRVSEPRPEKFNALTDAVRRLEIEGDLRPGDRAGVLFNPEENASISDLASALNAAMPRDGQSSGTRVEVVLDQYETGWIVIDTRRFEQLVASLVALNSCLFGRGNGDRLLAAAIGMEFERRNAYWIFNYKRGRFHPLVHAMEGDRRDNEAELRLGEAMENAGVDVESSLEHWYGLGGIPF